MKRRILFVSDAPTFAQGESLLAMAQSLDPSLFEVHFAAPYWDESLFRNASFTFWPIDTFFGESSDGWDSGLWEEDNLLRDVLPDLVIGHGRLSLCVSAPSAGVPLIHIGCSGPGVKVPSLNRARRKRGLPPLNDCVVFQANENWALMPNAAGVVPLEVSPSPHRFQDFLVAAQIPHPPLRGTFPQEGKEIKEFPSPLGRGQGEGAEPLHFLKDFSVPVHRKSVRKAVPQVVPARLRRVAEEAPDKPAFWGLAERQRGESPLTYAQVWSTVQSLAAGLLECGLQKGERVGFLAGVDPGWELFHHAVLLAGGVVVGLDLHEAPERVLGAARESGIRGWIVQNEQVINDWPALWTTPHRFIVLLHSDTPGGTSPRWISLTSLLDRHRGTSFSSPPPTPDDLATVIFTSGTTGEPRGIAYSHAQLVHAIRAIGRATHQLPAGFQAVCWLPLSNLFQRIVNLCSIERMSAITFVPNPRDLVDSLPLIRPTILIGVPRFFEKLESGIRKTVSQQSRLRRAVFHFALECRALCERWRLNKKAGRFFLGPVVRVFDGVAARRVRQSLGGELAYLVSGSAPINPKTIEFFSGLGLPILEAYGTSENAIPIALNRPDAYCPGTVGRPLAPNDVRISEDGEVLVKGPSVFSGYWNKPKDPSLFHGAYLRTGDEGQWVGAGFLRLTGRRSDIIKTSTGRRVAPGPIEEKFKEIPFVDQALVVGNGRKGPVLVVSLKEGTPSGGPSPLSEALTKTTGLLPPLSRPLGIYVLNRPFSLENGELTANLKLRRRNIEERLAPVLDKLYASIETADRDGPPIWFD